MKNYIILWTLLGCLCGGVIYSAIHEMVTPPSVQLKFLTNIYDPSRDDASLSVSCADGETMQEAWQKRLRYLDGKILGDPHPTAEYTVEELQRMGMVGVYIKETQ